MINKLQLILLFAISFLTVKNYLLKKEVTEYKKKNTVKKIEADYNVKKILEKFNFLKTKDKFLSRQGYPLNLNIITYYATKLILSAIFVISASINYKSSVIAIIFLFIGYFLIDLYILINKKIRDAEICTDLLNVSNSISLQLSANITLKDSLKKQFEICKNKDFRRAMLEFSTKYELSELNAEKPLEELKNKFDILELNMFCNALMEYNKVENIIEILENLSEVLKVKYMARLREATRTKILYITFGVILALGNIILLTFYPLFISLGQGFNTIFN